MDDMGSKTVIAVATILAASLLVASTGTLSASAATAPSADKCEAVYKQYPLHAKCPHASTACIAENQRNREARIAAGCKPERDYRR